jgi:pyridoxamine 5'-phosphate oxidase
LRRLLETEVDPDPLVAFRAWWDEARATGDMWSDAMVLSTVTPDGCPAARAVILRGLDERGFLFFTDTRSAKAGDLAVEPRAALVFLWSALERQVRVTGRVAPLVDDEVEAFFARRPRQANVVARLAPQDAVLAGPEVLEARLREVSSAHPGRSLGRPPGWGGFVVAPEQVELWQGRSDGLHDRLRYTRQQAGWRIERLAP